jgi:hypothetical protein
MCRRQSGGSPVAEQQQIGVALSGGGYRASAWGMGTLLYLADAGLNGCVTTVSSVSGGSITNATVALTDFRNADRAEVWRVGARLSRRCSGSVPGLVAMLVLNGACWILMVLGGAIHRPTFVAVGGGAALVFSFVGAWASRDATFGQPITWLYLGLAMLVASWLSFMVGDGWWWLLGAFLLAALLLVRGTVVGWAMGRSLLRVDEHHRARLQDMAGGIEHVMCACDLHGRHHVYFGRDFVYSFGLGLGARPTLALSAAVQSSANLPGAFATRAMRRRPFGFAGGRYSSPVLALTDGGVYDNMAEEWLVSYRERTTAMRRRALRIADPSQRATAVARADRLKEREPGFIVVANASGPLGFKFAWTTFVPLFGELFSLLRVKSILYDNGNTTRRRRLVDQFTSGARNGVIVHISTDPWGIVDDGRKSEDATVRGRADAVAAVLEATPGLRPDETKRPASAGTVLYPLRSGRIGNLLQRSFALAMTQAHVWHDLPVVDIPPIDDFRAMERGHVPMSRRAL